MGIRDIAAMNSAFCASCLSGWALAGETCERCTYAPVVSWLLTLLMLCGAAGFVILQVVSALKGSGEDSSSFSKACLRQALNFMQTVGPIPLLPFLCRFQGSDTSRLQASILFGSALKPGGVTDDVMNLSVCKL